MMKKFIATLILTQFISFLSFPQTNKFITVECANEANNETFEVRFTRSVPLVIGSQGLTVKVNAVNSNVINYKYVNSNVEDLMFDRSDASTFNFFPPTKRYRNDFIPQLILEPKYINSEGLQTCSRIKINLPIKVNDKPKSTITDLNYVVPLQVMGNSVKKTINGTDLISDDDYVGGTWSFVNHDPGFSINSSDGIITFSHGGTLINGASEEHIANLKYTDWDNFDARINIKIKVTAAAIPPTLSSQTFAQSFVEGITSKIGTIRAVNAVSNSYIPVDIIGTQNDDGSFNPSIYRAEINDDFQLEWNPPYNIVKDNNSKNMVFQIRPIGHAIPTSKITVNVLNRTDTFNQNKLTEALEIYNRSNMLFLQKINRAACLLAHTVSYLENDNMTLATISASYSDLSNLGLNIPAQVIPFIDVALSIAQGFSNNKRRKAEVILTGWKNNLQPIVTNSQELRKELLSRTSNNYMDIFTNSEEANNLLGQANAFKSSVENITEAIFQVEAITTLVNRRRRKELRLSCPFTSSSSSNSLATNIP